MKHSQKVWVDCQISRSAFSSERVFEISQTDGKVYVGVAPAHYLRNENGEALRLDEPAENETINGQIFAIVVKNGGDTARIAIPDGEAVIVNIQQVKRAREKDHVPV